LTKFRSGKRKDGSRFVFPIDKIRNAEKKVAITKVRIQKHNPWGRFAQRDIKRERDVIEGVEPDRDWGWLAVMEGGVYKQYDEDEQARIEKLLETAQNGTKSEKAIAITKIETEYPDIYEAFTGKKSDLPRS
jgi:hypothetical protein